MGIEAWLSSPRESEVSATLSEVNRKLAVGGCSISREDAQMLAVSRAATLAETERVEFGAPTLVAIAEAVADSPCLLQSNVADTLFGLQEAFYTIRDELPLDVPDAEIVEALRGCLDAWGDVNAAATMPPDEIMRFSTAYVRASDAEHSCAYRIVDDERRAYVFDSSDWDYDEYADGWDGERWADD